MTSEDDPFGVFGDSDEEDDVEVEETEASRIARSLVSLATFPSPKANALQATPTEPAVVPTDYEDVKNASKIEATLWNEFKLPWSDPLFLGPIKIVASLPFGGGRGFVAERDIQPGNLVLVEEPLVSWSVNDNKPDLQTLQTILELPHANQIALDLEFFHPTKKVVDAGEDYDNPEQVNKMMRTLRSQYSENPQLPFIVEFAKERGILNSDGSFISETDILRLLLALRYNGLESGIFRYAAMLNHADQPNCVKFMPTDGQKYSEVRATRLLSRGEPLTISYVPRILSHASRRKHLWEQHRFDIGVDLFPNLREMELIGRRLPPSAPNLWDENSTTSRIEMTIAELDDMYKDVAKHNPAEISEQARALEQASLELCTEAEHQLQNKNHLLLIPCLKLHVDSCDLVQRDPSLKVSERLKLLGRLVVTARWLLKLQILFYGPDHFEIGTTDLDLLQAIEELLSLSPAHLLSLQIEGLNSMSSWSSLEHQLRQDYDRIKGLYPRDADKLVQVANAQK